MTLDKAEQALERAVADAIPKLKQARSFATQRTRQALAAQGLAESHERQVLDGLLAYATALFDLKALYGLGVKNPGVSGPMQSREREIVVSTSVRIRRHAGAIEFGSTGNLASSDSGEVLMAVEHSDAALEAVSVDLQQKIDTGNIEDRPETRAAIAALKPLAAKLREAREPL